MRKVWVVNETSDSNPQLAEHLLLLSDALHMQLQLVEWEAWIGRYNGDILTDDQKSDAAIVIEHRSDETYHYQLGQVLNCAEDYDARILIWIADNFREEHRAALDWLNRWTPEGIQVFGVELHTTKLGDKEADIEFIPVVFPKGWSRRGESRPIPKKLQSVQLREFFQPLIDALRNAGFTERQNAASGRYQPFPSGVSGLSYTACLENDGTAWVYISGGTANLNTLRKDKCKQTILDGLDLDADTGINWRVSGSGSLGVYRKGSIDDPEEELEDIRKWMFHYLLKFKKVFNPRMEKIIEEMENSG